MRKEKECLCLTCLFVFDGAGYWEELEGLQRAVKGGLGDVFKKGCLLYEWGCASNKVIIAKKYGKWQEKLCLREVVRDEKH